MGLFPKTALRKAERKGKGYISFRIYYSLKLHYNSSSIKSYIRTTIMRSLNLVGQVYGDVTVLEREGSDHKGNSLWLCKCECGNSFTARGDNLKAGRTKSCGCKIGNSLTGEARAGIGNQVKHGMKGTPIYSSWKNMKSRCLNPSHKSYPEYGGRGITICDRWLDPINGFTNFLEDMGEKPKESSLDRIDNNGNYEPSNCRWATAKQQNRNQRTTVLTEEIVSLTKAVRKGGGNVTALAKVLGINPKTLHNVTSGHSWKDIS